MHTKGNLSLLFWASKGFYVNFGLDLFKTQEYWA